MQKARIVVIPFLFFLAVACTKEKSANTNNPFTDEPPKNNFLADSPWPITHCNPYAQASSPFEGPSSGEGEIYKKYQSGTPGMITIAISGMYPSGNRILWGGNASHVVKAIDTGSGFNIIAFKEKEDVSVGSIFSVDASTSGAYTLIDKDNIFYTPRGIKLYAYGDAIANDEFSPIQLLRTFVIPAFLVAADERIVGMTMTYDGYIAFATNNGLIGLVSRNFSEFFHYRFTGEEISNSIACDEENGIYVVTSKKMYRVQWTGTELSIDEDKGGWTADYETGSGSSGIRLGAGSGSTPTLMGIQHQDKFVVITDGQDLMHLVLFWRNKIPDDWTQIPGSKDRRIAAQVPVTFGNPSSTRSLSEQSVCVRGYGALVVNNELKNAGSNKTANILLSGLPGNAPYGAEKFIWNPATRQLKSAWVNTSVSLPSGIPCMSAATNLAYCMGQKNGIWNFTALDWNTGNTAFEIPFGNQLQYNSAYAATEVGLNKGLYSGTLFGAVGAWQK